MRIAVPRLLNLGQCQGRGRAWGIVMALLVRSLVFAGPDTLLIGTQLNAPIDLMEHVWLVEDRQNAFTLDDLMRGRVVGVPHGSLEHGSSLWAKPTQFWLRFVVRNTSDVTVGCWVRYETVWDSVVTHLPRTGAFSVTTNRRPMKADPFGYPMRTYLELAPGAVEDIVVHVYASNSILETPLRNFALYPVSSASRQDLLDRIFQSFWFGFVLLMVIYLFGSYIAFRERSFLHILWFIPPISLHFSLLKGTIFMALPPSWTLPAVGVLTTTSLLTGVVMMISLTGMKQSMPGAVRWLYRVMAMYAVLGLAIMFLAPSPIMIGVFNILTLVPVIMILRGVLHALLVARTTGRIQAVGLLIGTLGAVVQLLLLLGVLRPGFVVGNFFQASIGIMLMLFAIAISRRAWRLRTQEAEQREAALRNDIDRIHAEADLLVERESRALVEQEKQRSDELLHNILPEEVAAELKATGHAKARHFANTTILFSDFIDFTRLSEQLSPAELVEELNNCFMAFDGIMDHHGVEKIKTIGDAYMAAGGLPDPTAATAADVVRAGLAMQSFMRERQVQRCAAGLLAFSMRLGIHTGPVVAGIVGTRKFQYDIWGDTVNIANRMESAGEVGRVNISEATYQLVKDEPEFHFTPRGKVLAKGKGELEMYFVDAAMEMDVASSAWAIGSPVE